MARQISTLSAQRLDQTARHKQQANKALHPTAYSSVRFGRRLPSLSPLPAPGELVVLPSRAAWLDVQYYTNNMDNPSDDRRIHNLNDLIELWPEVLRYIKKKIGVTAVAYLHDATPVALTEEEIVLEYQKEFHLKKVIEASDRLPFEKIINECLATQYRLHFKLAHQREG